MNIIAELLELRGFLLNVIVYKVPNIEANILSDCSQEWAKDLLLVGDSFLWTTTSLSLFRYSLQTTDTREVISQYASDTSSDPEHSSTENSAEFKSSSIYISGHPASVLFRGPVRLFLCCMV